VIAYLDRRREKGVVYDFRPFGEGFTIYSPEDTARERGRPIEFKAIKAIYFVRTHEGNKDRRENKLALGTVYRQGRKISVSFPDGERYVGITEGFNPQRAGFFFFPGDPKSNNLEVFIVTANTDEVRLIGAEAGGGDKVFKPNADRGVFVPEKRLEAVQRVLRGEPLDAVAKDLSVPAETLFEWRARFMAGGPAALGIVPPKEPAPGAKPGPPTGPPKPPTPGGSRPW
jgi:hypothetical protein